ncbi:MAG: GTPase HflX [Deltaproteobacteria bacterium]|nr:GTPase HflX [Deltaproteobacteria bacterium]MBW2385447.1 GTPase HflX [Deltaproteobacteria bacterium]MBW2697314.1 GTPase HflX [Deltaproteobacteria bacterium]
MLPSLSIPAEGRPRAVLVGIQLPEYSTEQVESSLDELARLCKTLGLDPVARITQRRPSTGAAMALGAGKVRELARLTGGEGVVPSPVPSHRRGSSGDGKPDEVDTSTESTLLVESEERKIDEVDREDDEQDEVGDDSEGEKERAEVVVFDHDLTPTQLRNLEGATGARVLDRSTVILHIFQRHARSREARIQVEIASLKYLTPRLRATGGGARDRQQGGIGVRGGAGESALELDRRRVRDRIAELEKELVSLAREASGRRERRGARTVSLVGYTNAGKSTLMRALTGADVLVDDRLFATLDTTVRALHPEPVPRVLISDTVGFVDRLPHDLVASFRSTLAEAREAELMLHVVDAADPLYLERLAVTRRVLAELGAGEQPELLVLSKADRLDALQREALAAVHPEAIVVSARSEYDVAALHGQIVAWLERAMVEASLFVPYRTPRLLHVIHERARVLSETHEADGTRVTVRAPATVIEELQAVVAG